MPRTCQWPTNPDATDFDDTVESCGIADPSFDAHGRTPDGRTVAPVCDKHAEKAKATGYHITPAGEEMPAPIFPADLVDAEILPTLTVLATNGPDVESHDPELVALAQVADIIGDLPDYDTRRRVATWVADRYGADA